ncbi:MULTISPECIES: SDR family NAD(P)-dependent oxidoreductase [unclassified Pantoea]|uniref:SDR family NAD(P)-dependent oxidoreductase n=1 Tax=unclassified Pantoea TaxID=2630326 RepID=UPI001CD316B1|nr:MULTISPECIES: SDR family oxidoreductase [unclassified Pantoea]MCA1179153.1 SDR family oxidoreductase [Pantoea sp. alder69]MCA1253758.1 SDR family oxidoreductase [Pantoea sp. alder70]MCA1267642.1 SDR family oxidoreductase [Pantoea sp. alder81]
MSHKIALITGGNRGLGKNGALKLAAKGVDILFTYRGHVDEAQAVVKEIEALGARAVALQLDVGDSSTFDSFVAQVKETLQNTWQRDNFDYLVNNAGHGHYKLFAETTEEEFDALINVHFKGPYFLTQKLLPLIIDGGRILNVSSGLTRMTLPGSGTYASVKGAMEVLTRYQAKELGERRIRVNILAPGAIETDFGGGRVRDTKDLNDHIASVTSLGRVGQPDDIGDAISAILSEETGWITAQRIEASGGQAL